MRLSASLTQTSHPTLALTQPPIGVEVVQTLTPALPPQIQLLNSIYKVLKMRLVLRCGLRGDCSSQHQANRLLDQGQVSVRGNWAHPL